MRPELTKILATLSKAEKDELLDYLKFRRARGVKEESHTLIEMQVWEAMLGVFKRRGWAMGNLTVFISRYGHDKYSEACAHVQALMRQGNSASVERLTNMERQRVIDECMRCLAEWIDSREYPAITLSPSTMCDNMHRLPQALQLAFPGYVGAGVLGFLVGKALMSSSRL